MSARQNKKQRKGRNNPNNRERTVTTLTEDPNSSYLIPLSSEDPPGALMSSPFSIASSAGNGSSSSAYQPPSSYEAYGYTDFSSQPQGFTQQAHQQPQPQKLPKIPLIPGKNDLERLENLKNIIKANQHANYRPIAQPAALAALYLGPQAQPEQCTNGCSPQAIAATVSGSSSPTDLGRRPPRLQSKEWENSARGKSTTTNGGEPINNVLPDSSSISAQLLTPSSFSFSTQTNSPIRTYERRLNQGSNVSLPIDTSNLQGGTTISSAEPSSAGPKTIDVLMSDARSDGPGHSPRFELGGARPNPGNTDPARIPDETGYGGLQGPGNTDKSSFDNKDDLHTPRDGSWSMRNGPPLPDDRRRDVDRSLSSPRPTLNGGGGGPDTRLNPSDRPLNFRDPLPPRDDRFYERDRERERERFERDRRDWDRDRRSFYDRPRPPPDVNRRPPPEQRHYEPDYSDRVPRRYDSVKEEPISDSRRLAELRRLPSPMADGRPPVRPEDDRLSLSARLPPSNSDSRAPPVVVSRPHADSRAPVPPQRVPSPDNRPVRGASFDDRHMKPATLPEERRGAPAPPDVRVPPNVRPADLPGASRPADVCERDVTLPPVDTSRPPIPLEERISRPSLQERISSAQPEHLSHPLPPPTSRSEPTRALEERLSAIPVSADSREQRIRVSDRAERLPPPPPPPPPSSRPLQSTDDRIASRPPPPAVPAQDDRSGRYTSGITPALDRSTYPPPVRDDTHSVNKNIPSPRSSARDYRPPQRPISRERSAASYRSDNRNYVTDDRRTDAMDVDTPSRYNDSRSLTYNRPFSPPSAADLARDRARVAQYPPSPSRPPPPHDTHSYDDDRRYPASRDWPPYQSSYSDRRREWTAADEEYYKSRQWDRNPPPPTVVSASDRDRYEREVPPPPIARNNGWETRDERERRDYPPPRVPSPSRPYDGLTRSLGSRMTDTYSSPAPGGTSGDRSYPPRDIHPTLSRVRQRSLSPARRSGGPVIDDNRPPAKRSRENGYGTGEYYPQSAVPIVREPGAPIRRQDSYTSLARVVSPPAPLGGGSAYFDNRGTSLPSSNATGGPDRDYTPREYPVQPYERARSPPRGAAYSRGGYSRDTRDDRRYLPPPPPPIIPPRRP